MQVVIVESPAKAKTINKYLGSGYKVLASFGHVRDLPSKDGSVLPDQDFEMLYEVTASSSKHVAEITRAVKDSTGLLLATDPDREGEAISWHLLEILKQKKALNKSIKIGRVVFNEITKRAVTEGVANPREIDMNLVNAQQARRALDYLVGFNISPLLWRKLPGSKSAGRVQSVALRLICERDEEIEKFITREYWDITAIFQTTDGANFSARLTHLSGGKLEQFSLPDAKLANEAVATLEGKKYAVVKVEEKQARRNPYPPFTTSTLQQEASRKLGFSTSKTMNIAQKLYEGFDIGGETTGLITYMRTDGVQLSNDAINQARKLIPAKFGDKYLPDSPRIYKNKAKNAQEAHEAIRPTDLSREPGKISSYLDKDALALYDLIWKRTLASQMENAVFDQVAVDIAAHDDSGKFRANGSVIKFDGFLKLYQEGKDTQEESQDENSRLLPPLKSGDKVKSEKITPNQHFTQPPPRFTEAGLVKKLEELGIGRPSTYSSIITTLINRGYAKLEKRAFHAEERGRIVNAFLVNFFRRYVEYDFTADLEEKLDEISAGDIDWKVVMKTFWDVFAATVEGVKPLKQSEVIDKVEEALAAHIFPPGQEGADPRVCKTCGNGRLSLKMGKFGAFIGCSNYPECKFTRELVAGNSESKDNGDSQGSQFPKELGIFPETGRVITLKIGPYGPYVETELESGLKRVSLPKGVDAALLTLEDAIKLVKLPREVGLHPESGKKITAGLGRFGPYLLHDGKYVSLRTLEDVLEIGINRAVDAIAAKTGGTVAGRSLGDHPDGGEVKVLSGRYGPYLKYGKNNYKLPKQANPDTFTLEEALGIIAEAPAPQKAASAKPSARKKTAAKKEVEAEEKPAKPAKAAKTAAKPAGKKAAPEKTVAAKSPKRARAAK